MSARDRTLVVRVEHGIDDFLEEYRESHGLRSRSDALRAIVESEMSRESGAEYGRRRLDVEVDVKTFSALAELAGHGGYSAGQILSEALPLWEERLVQRGRLHKAVLGELETDAEIAYAHEFGKKGKGGSAKR